MSWCCHSRARASSASFPGGELLYSYDTPTIQTNWPSVTMPDLRFQVGKMICFWYSVPLVSKVYACTLIKSVSTFRLLKLTGFHMPPLDVWGAISPKSACIITKTAVFIQKVQAYWDFFI